MGHVTLTTLLLGWFVTRKVGLDIIDLCAKFDDSSLHRSK